MSRTRIFLPFTGLLLCIASTAHALTLTLTADEFPPFNYTVNGTQAGGICSDILAEAARRANIPVHIRILPWARALGMAKTQSDTCVFSTIRNDEREKQFKWVGPLILEEVTLFAAASNPITLRSIDEVKNYSVGGYTGDAYGDIVEKLAGVKVERAPVNALNLKKLKMGRIDLWVSSARGGPYAAAVNGMKGEVKPVLKVGSKKDAELWLACNPSIPNDVVKKLDDTVRNVIKDGTAAKIESKYMNSMRN